MKQQTERAFVNYTEKGLPANETFTQIFQCFGHSIEHKNQLQVQGKSGRLEKFQIRNHLTTIFEEKVEKITEIKVDETLIKIVNTFTSVPQQKKPQTFRIRRQTLYKKIMDKTPRQLLIQNGRQELVSRDVKNVVKNIIKLFRGWIEDLNPYRADLSNSLNNLILRNEKYNNSLILSLSKHSKLRSIFIIFCEEEGQNLIKESRIRDKSSHLEALARYYQICCHERDSKIVQKQLEVKKEADVSEPGVKIEEDVAYQ